MNNPKKLRARYPYQFAGEQISMSYSRGWFHLFSQLCADIDHALGDDKRGFHWTQVKEKFGSARLYFQMTPGVSSDESDLMQRLLSLKNEAEAASQRTCVACGQPGRVYPDMGWMLAVCETHHQEQAAGTLGSIYFEDDEQ
jgi:hypothetical protein